ncbi:hypothetical protein [Burkholderia lata]|uniref:hypothetical protein n=1 Tax=Burkholderia lata (strain ATCC 17760 / DSM 23089 / LMG 22485 / NCIMB 9086 / R18194 / 383) TaxID=482957 RepID=UPI0039996240
MFEFESGQLKMHSNELARGFPDERSPAACVAPHGDHAPKARAAGLCERRVIERRGTGRDNPDENLFLFESGVV